MQLKFFRLKHWKKSFSWKSCPDGSYLLSLCGEHVDPLVSETWHQIPLGVAPSDADQRKEPPPPWP